MSESPRDMKVPKMEVPGVVNSLFGSFWVNKDCPSSLSFVTFMWMSISEEGLFLVVSSPFKKWSRRILESPSLQKVKVGGSRTE